MAEPNPNKSVTRGYSLPRWMHRRIHEEAEARGWSDSMVINQAMRRWWFGPAESAAPTPTEKAG